MELFIRTRIVTTVAIAMLAGPLLAQENKPVPKDSARVSVPGCTKGYIFTVGSRAANEAGSNFDIPEGMHLRMNGPKTIMKEIKGHEGSMVEITGLMRKGQYNPEGVGIGKGVRITPGPQGNGGTQPGNPIAGQIQIDVEGWRPAVGSCPSR